MQPCGRFPYCNESVMNVLIMWQCWSSTLLCRLCTVWTSSVEPVEESGARPPLIQCILSLLIPLQFTNTVWPLCLWYVDQSCKLRAPCRPVDKRTIYCLCCGGSKVGPHDALQSFGNLSFLILGTKLEQCSVGYRDEVIWPFLQPSDSLDTTLHSLSFKYIEGFLGYVGHTDIYKSLVVAPCWICTHEFTVSIKLNEFRFKKYVVELFWASVFIFSIKLTETIDIMQYWKQLAVRPCIYLLHIPI